MRRIGAATVDLTKPEQLRGPESPKTWTGCQHDTEPHRRRSVEGLRRHLRNRFAARPEDCQRARGLNVAWLAGHRYLRTRLSTRPPATASDALRVALDAEGYGRSKRLNPLHAWHFARSLNLPKTDRDAQNARVQRDAAMLARLGAERRPAPIPLTTGTAMTVRSSSAAISSSAWKSGEEPPRRRPSSPRRERHPRPALEPRPPRRRHGGCHPHPPPPELDRHPDLGETERLLRSIPGVGQVTAITINAWLAELAAAGQPRHRLEFRPRSRRAPATRVDGAAAACWARGGDTCGARSKWRA